MLGLSDSERILMMCSAVLTQRMRVTDGRIDRQTDGIGVVYTCYSIYAVTRKNGLVKQTDVPVCVMGFAFASICWFVCLSLLKFLRNVVDEFS